MSQAAEIQVSETPRVDAAERFMHAFGKPPVGFVLSEVARTLERELSLAWEVIEGRSTVEELTALQAAGAGGGAPAGTAAPLKTPSPEEALVGTVGRLWLDMPLLSAIALLRIFPEMSFSLLWYG